MSWSQPPPTLPRARVLIVDDHEPNLLALEAILAPLDVSLVRAHTGEEALRQLLQGEFAAILLDAQMPGMDGFETARIIKSRKRTRAIPIIFITALSRDASQIFKGYSYGAVDYLLKPFDPDILRSKVSVFIELFQKTEQIKHQEQLLREHQMQEMERRSEHRYRSLTDLMPLCVWAAKPNGEIYFRNQALLSYTGVEAESHADLGSLRGVHPEDQVHLKEAWERARQGQRAFELQLRLRNHADGRHRWHLCRAVPERDESGELVGWIVTATDVDDQRQVQEAREAALAQEHEAREQAEAANRAKDEFLAMVSHELRTPLTSILGWTSILRTRKPDEQKVARGLEIIDRNARAQKDLIEDILDVSRIVTGKLTLQLRPLELGPLVEASLDAVRPAAESKGVQLELERHDPLGQVEADSERLGQVVGNLLANAVKFTPAGGRVTVRLAREHERMRIEVADTGEGIPAEFLPHVFERFRQAESPSVRKHGGLGLGLAIVRHLVEQHGGTVRAASDGPGQGATFTVELPALPLVAQTPPEQDSSTPSLTGLRVLLVEDDPDAREALIETLEELGAQVEAVHDAASALDAVARSRPSIMVSDIGLPGVDGYQLIAQLRAQEPQHLQRLPAVALTAYASADSGQRALAAGFQAHLPKPYDLHRLALILSQLALPPAPVLATGTG